MAGVILETRRILEGLALAGGVLLAAQAMGAADCPPSAAPLTAEEARAGIANARDHGFLWRLRKDGRTSYLYGTMHVAGRDWMFPGPRLQEALRSSDTLALELDVLDPAIQSAMADAVARMHHDPLPAALEARLRTQAQAACVPYESIISLSPEWQVITIGMMVARRDGLDPAYGIDAVLSGAGHQAGKSVVSLETVSEQIGLMQMSSAAETERFVADGLDELESGREQAMTRRISRAWADSDLGELERYPQWCQCMESAEERAWMKRLLDDRNPRLAERIDARIAGGHRVLAAVGSLHMVGPGGLPALLEKRGYEVERVVQAPH